MKKLLKICLIILGVIVLLYLVSIPILRSKNVIKETVFFTPTKYDKANIFNQLDAKYLKNISKDSVLLAADKFISSDRNDSVVLNGTKIHRRFLSLEPGSSSEYYTIKPQKVKQVGIYMLGNQFNVFNMLDDLTELAKHDSAEICVIVYNGSGYSHGKIGFDNQFLINQKFYKHIDSLEKVRFVIGHSLGTVFATKLAVENKIPYLALLAPASNLNDLIDYFETQAPLWARPYLNFSEIKKNEFAVKGNSVENIKNYQGHLLLMHGTKDMNLPLFMSEKIYENSSTKSKDLIKIENGDHYAPLVGKNWDNVISFLKL